VGGSSVKDEALDDAASVRHGPGTEESLRAYPDASSRRRMALFVLLGCLLIQAAWILTLPPFRGTDEFDHAYRAAAVADGEWVPKDHSTVTVPEALVTAAHPVCASYEYTTAANCSPIRRKSDGRVEVLSRAANYNPVYYWLVGSAGRPFDGTASLYAMRVASSLLCSFFITLACWVTSLWARTRWPVVSVLVAMTPIVLFSIAIVAPNGLEMSAALSLWMALLGLCTQRGREKHGPFLLRVAATAAVVVATLRSLGPLWILMTTVVAVSILGRASLSGLVRRHRTAVAGSVFVVVMAAATAGAWTRTMGTQTLTPFDMGDIDPLSSTLEQIPLWFLQGVAAFPRRSDPAPLAVYVLVGLTVLAMLSAGLRAGTRRTRIVTTGTIGVAVALPTLFTYLTIDYSGPIWQGRYGLPFHMGVTLLAGFALDRSRRARAPGSSLTALLCMILTIANAVALVHVLNGERATSPLRDSTVWLSAPAWVVVAMVAGGFVAWAIASMLADPGATPERRGSPFRFPTDPVVGTARPSGASPDPRTTDARPDEVSQNP